MQQENEELKKPELQKVNYKGIIYLLSLIMVIGIVVLYSSSYIIYYKYPEMDFDYYLIRQMINIIVGLVFMFILAVIPFKKHMKMAPFYMVGVVFLLLAVFIFPAQGGSSRWIDFGLMNLQPSELAKIFLILFLSSYFFRDNENRQNGILEQLLIPLGWIIMITLLVAAEPDLSSSMIIFLIGLIVLYISGLKFSYFVFIMIICIIGIVMLFQLDLLKPYQMERIQSFLGLSQDIASEGQVDVSLQAISSGGFFGEGLGMGNYKYIIPVQFTDFIFAILGEELGFVGMAIFLFLYYFMCRNLINAAINGIYNNAAKVFIVAFAYLIMLQVVINVGVVFGLLPPTGVTLPFVSYGGSSMMAFLGGFGFFLSALNEKAE
ncbi:MAG: FtsW/RodA/SpoVE family cell cycle protein [Thermotogota bacterium]|nr:FtsW/RodA/SpoVE family cell cycle protein [Thermotogota bacterium]